MEVAVQNEEVVTTPVPEAVEERTVEQQMQDMRKISEMRFKSLSQLVELYIQSLTRIMISSNGVTELQKRQASSALVEAVRFTLDMGLDVTGAKIRQGGTLAREVNTLAGVLAQAMDTRMLLLADNMRRDEENNKNTAIEEVVETKGEENV
jgi:hypothetical protein